MPIKLGIVGNEILSAIVSGMRYSTFRKLEVCAVYSRHQETGDAFAAKYGITQVYTDYELFLESDLDAVLYCDADLCALSADIKKRWSMGSMFFAKDHHGGQRK